MTKNKECAERDEKWWKMWRKQNMWQLFSSPKQTLASKKGMLQKMFVWLSDLKRMLLELGWLQYISISALIYRRCQITYNILVPLTLPHTLYSSKHTLPLLPQRQDVNVSVPPQQFSLNGPPDNLLFSSVLLVWPLAQSLPQLSTKTQDLSPLSGGGSRKEKKKTWAHLLWYDLNGEL